MPKDSLPNGHFAKQTFCRNDILPNGHFAKWTVCRKDNLPKIEMVQRMTNLLRTCFDIRDVNKQTSIYKDNDISEFHFENHGIHSQFSGKSHSSIMLNDVILYIAKFQ